MSIQSIRRALSTLAGRRTPLLGPCSSEPRAPCRRRRPSGSAPRRRACRRRPPPRTPRWPKRRCSRSPGSPPSAPTQTHTVLQQAAGSYRESQRCAAGTPGAHVEEPLERVHEAPEREAEVVPVEPLRAVEVEEGEEVPHLGHGRTRLRARTPRERSSGKQERKPAPSQQEKQTGTVCTSDTFFDAMTSRGFLSMKSDTRRWGTPPEKARAGTPATATRRKDTVDSSSLAYVLRLLASSPNLIFRFVCLPY